MGKKVSVISPCHNGASYLNYYFESLLSQTYNDVEFIFVDDGSTDNTKEIYEKYAGSLKQKGWSCQYIYQEKSGQAAALNQGLKIFSGEYLIYPDSDDIMYPFHIEEKVKYMEEHPDVGIAYCVLDAVSYDNLDEVLFQFDFGADGDMFKKALNEEKILWTPMGNIIRSSSLLDVIPSRHIYEGLFFGSQNCQVQMPLLYSCKCGYINKSLGKYVIRTGSSSRTSKQFKRRINVMWVWINTLCSIKRMPLSERIYCLSKIFYNNLGVIFKFVIKEIFSIRNYKEEDIKYKLITIMGLKLKVKLK